MIRNRYHFLHSNVQLLTSHFIRSPGLPSRIKLPSRNWLIFLSLVGGITGAITYDKRERKRIQAEWCDRVSALSRQPLPVDKLPRRITVVLGTFPGDSIVHTREYFHEYVKPILNAAAMDWDVVEGVREGDIRYGVAERIRRYRRAKGEGSAFAQDRIPEVELMTLLAGGEELTDKEKAFVNKRLTEEFRTRHGIEVEPGVGGDLVIGRHAWKEYVRGLHEGWLGPADSPARPDVEVEPKKDDESKKKTEDGDDAAAAAAAAEKKAADARKEAQKRARRLPRPPTIEPTEYGSASLAPTTPEVFDPVVTVPFPHIMGFLNSSIRMWRFLNRRYLADDVGRRVAALIHQQRIGSFVPERADDGEATTATETMTTTTTSADETIESMLVGEEKCWHKSVWKRRDEDVKKAAEKEKEKEKASPTTADSASPVAVGDDATAVVKKKEYEWTDPMVLDSRIVERMRRFEPDPNAVYGSPTE